MKLPLRPGSIHSIYLLHHIYSMRGQFPPRFQLSSTPRFAKDADPAYHWLLQAGKRPRGNIDLASIRLGVDTTSQNWSKPDLGHVLLHSSHQGAQSSSLSLRLPGPVSPVGRRSLSNQNSTKQNPTVKTILEISTHILTFEISLTSSLDTLALLRAPHPQHSHLRFDSASGGQRACPPTVPCLR